MERKDDKGLVANEMTLAERMPRILWTMTAILTIPVIVAFAVVAALAVAAVIGFAPFFSGPPIGIELRHTVPGAYVGGSLAAFGLAASPAERICVWPIILAAILGGCVAVLIPEVGAFTSSTIWEPLFRSATKSFLRL